MGILRNIGLLATCRGSDGPDDAGLLSDAAMVWSEGRIVWTGRAEDLDAPGEHEEYDAGGRLVVPGLVDCHTHLAFGGWRADEFERRSRGVSYVEIGRSGGGIISTVRSTRETSSEDLLQKVTRHAAEMAALGVTTIECKSGYGLTLEDELRILEVYRTLSERGPQRIVPTFLGAHTVPAEFNGRGDEYVNLVCGEMIPKVAQARLAEFCDVFVEKTAFSVDAGRRVLEAGLTFGLRPKLHADQITSGGGAELAADVGAVSADHLECVSDAGVRALAQAAVVAVSLPIASLYLGLRPLDGRRLIEAGVRVAVATDFNPGSAPSYHLPLALTLACTMNHLTPAEALIGGTLNAARAVGMSEEVGSLEPGKRADFALVDADSVNQWLYHFRPNAVAATFIDGRIVSGRLDNFVPQTNLE